MLSSELILIVFFLIPLVWSGVITGLRRLWPATCDDRTEKRLLLLMLAPIMIGVAVVVAARLMPLDNALPLLPMVETEMGHVAEVETAGPVTLNFDVLARVPQGLLALYAVVAGVLAIRVGATHLRLVTLAATARPESEIRVTPAAIPPVTLGRNILIPQSLMTVLSSVQLGLIIDHEREHLRRGDPAWFAVLAWIDALFWFNPFIRLQTRRCRLAAELACDAAVTAVRPDMRKAYAETLVIALKHAAGNVLAYAPAAFSNAQSGDYRMRIMQIMRPSADGRKPRRLLYTAIAVLAVPVVLSQYAWSQAPASPAATSAEPFTVFPVSGRISSGFGMRIHPITQKPTFHNGIDFAIPEGTEVHSVAAGTVSFAGEREGYHKVVEIDHGGGRKTRYAQMGGIRAKTGDQVKADAVVGTSGAYGTGPHLHFEVWQDEKPIDPQSIFGEGIAANFSADSIHKSADGTLAMAGEVRIEKGGRTVSADALTVKP